MRDGDRQGPDNAAIAERLEALAALLDLAGASYYSVRAYRRAAELIRSTPAPAVLPSRAPMHSMKSNFTVSPLMWHNSFVADVNASLYRVVQSRPGCVLSG